MTLKERVLNRLQGKEVDMTPVGCATTYGVVDFMKKCGYERPLADTDPQAMTELAMAGHTYGGFEWVKAMGWDIAALSEALGCEMGTPKIDRQYYINSFPYAGGSGKYGLPLRLPFSRPFPGVSGASKTPEGTGRGADGHFR